MSARSRVRAHSADPSNGFHGSALLRLSCLAIECQTAVDGRDFLCSAGAHDDVRRWVSSDSPSIAEADVGLAVTARIWSDDPWVSAYDFGQRQIGVPSQAVAIAWMGLSAFTDGTLTAALVYRFMKARRSSVFESTQSLAARLIALTLETVLLTHLVGGVMCVIFLASPPARRTDQDMFWVLLEIITELYALSILFTINARAKFRRVLGPQSEGTEPPIPLSDKVLPAHQSAIDMQVEGYQGSSPFGVAPYKVGLHKASATDPSTKDSSMVETPNEIPLPVLYMNEGSSGGFASERSGNSSAESAKPAWSASKRGE